MAVYVPDPDRTLDDLVEDLAAVLADRYREAEDTLIREIAVRARRDLELAALAPTETVPGGLTAVERRRQNRILAELAGHRAQSIRELQGLAVSLVERLRRADLAGKLVDAATREGEAAMARILGFAVKQGASVRPLPWLGSAVQISAGQVTSTAAQATAMVALNLQSRLEILNQRITRYPQDAYQRIVSIFSPQTLLGVTTSRQQQAMTVQRFLAEGIRGFEDRSGRWWRVGSYAEMAGRTSVARAFNDAGVWRMQQAGVNLGVITGAADACKKCAPWIGRIISLDGSTGAVQTRHATTGEPITVEVAGTEADARNSGWGHPNCFPGWVPVSAPMGIAAADSRWFEGEVIVIHTASGRELTVTPNHPVLTAEGWVAAGALMEGQNLIRYCGDVKRPVPGRPDHEGVETPIREVFETLRQSGHVTTVTVPGAAEQFHGDGSADSEVEVVFSDGLLGCDGEPTALNLAPESKFFLGGVREAELFRVRAALQVFHTAGHPTDGLVGGGGQRGAFLSGHSGHAETQRGGAVTGRDAVFAESGRDGRAGYPEPGAEGLDGFPGAVCGDERGHVEVGALGDLNASGSEASSDYANGDTVSAGEFIAALTGLVATDQTVNVERRHFAGHVYNLHTSGGWYTANSVIVHNCRDKIVAYLPGLSVPQAGFEYDDRAAKDREKQRELEREVRQAKRLEAAAMTDTDRQKAARAVRVAQADLREFTRATGRSRDYAREQLRFADG